MALHVDTYLEDVGGAQHSTLQYRSSSWTKSAAPAGLRSYSLGYSRFSEMQTGHAYGSSYSEAVD